MSALAIPRHAVILAGYVVRGYAQYGKLSSAAIVTIAVAIYICKFSQRRAPTTEAPDSNLRRVYHYEGFAINR
jgi:hypothetical protein